MTKKRIVAIAATVVAISVVATGCGSGKALEPFNDAPVNSQNKGGADVVNMPDGFSNVATKCDHGNRVYVVFHGDSTYGSVAVAPKDPTCPQS